MKVFKLTLVRHGETAHNRLRLLQGQLETQLNDMGRQQAKLLAKYFDKAGVRFDQVYTSDLMRACETCEILVQGKYHTSRMYSNPLLRERSYASLEGLPKDVARARARLTDDLNDPINRAQATASTSSTALTNGVSGARVSEDLGTMQVPSVASSDWLGRRASGGDGETLEQLQERVREFCEEVLFKSVEHGQRVLVVSHGGTIREFMKLFRDKYHARIGHADIVITANTAINDFDFLLSTPDNLVKCIKPINIHQIPHMTFDVYNRDNPNPSLNFQMTTLEQFCFNQDDHQH